jgi:hypothetical protein
MLGRIAEAAPYLFAASEHLNVAKVMAGKIPCRLRYFQPPDRIHLRRSTSASGCA